MGEGARLNEQDLQTDSLRFEPGHLAGGSTLPEASSTERQGSYVKEVNM